MSVILLQDFFKFTDSEKMHIFCVNAQEALLLGTVFQMRATASVVCRVMGACRHWTVLTEGLGQSAKSLICFAFTNLEGLPYRK